MLKITETAIPDVKIYGVILHRKAPEESLIPSPADHNL